MLNGVSNEKIAIITRSYPSEGRPICNGGVEKIMVILSGNLSTNNAVSVLTQKHVHDGCDTGGISVNLKVYRLGKPLKNYSVSLGGLLHVGLAWISYITHSMVKTSDTIIAGDHTTYIPGVLASMIYKKKLVIFWHDFLGTKWVRYFGIAGLGGIFSEVVALFYPSAVHCCLTNFTCNKIKRASVSKKTVKYLLPNDAHKLYDKEKFQKTKQILMVGRLVRYKNHREAVMLFERFNKENEDWRLLIVGQGPEEDTLGKIIETKGLTDCITIKKSLTDQELEAEYAKSRVLLHLSELEGFSLVISEAINMDCKVIALYLPVYEELYKGKVCFLYDKHDYEGFANHMFS